MKRSCKYTDITNPRTVRPWVMDCLRRHYKRYDFKHLLLTIGGLTHEEYRQILSGEKAPLARASYPIAEEAARRIKERKLDLAPVHIGVKVDISTRKTRLIGKESAMQQIFDHIAKGSCEPIFKRRIVPQQASSIKGRGQYYGTAMISRWMRKDARAGAWAKRHNKRYYRKTRWFVKMDVQKCYPSCRAENFMRLFRNDCANDDILWLWETLLKSHRVKIDGTEEYYEGFMIGALPSQWACQYMLSFVYRHIMDMAKTRRGKRVKLVSHMLIFMDDFYLCSSSRNSLKTAAKELARYAREELGLTIKPNWQILDVDRSPVDMMGFQVHADGNITARPRVFLRARRIALRAKRRHGMCARQAERILSYKGFFRQNPAAIRKADRDKKAGRKQTRDILIIRCTRANRKLKLRQIFKQAARIMRRERKQHDSDLLQRAKQNQLYAVA